MVTWYELKTQLIEVMFNFSYHRSMIKLELKCFDVNLYMYLVESAAAALSEFLYVLLKSCW